MKLLTVKEVSIRLGKSEETIKRWIRSGKFPNSTKNSDKEGWRISESDLLELLPEKRLTAEAEPVKKDDDEEKTLVTLAFEAVTLTTPTEEIVTILSLVGIKRTLEILLIMQQSPTKVKNPLGFIKRAIRENWSASTLPKKINRGWQSIEEKMNIPPQREPVPFTFYNWLEEE
ncbi:helix-turn-helix domain-containing protein [Aneurinibacillus tyrosinisolvens]|uniref:helix-turn-helix domain-containing protein n=1 Tax=Aneurinibacillus tyrosinisolvens TaxID=1443435 RepID=UPI000699412E|nr:helix-turn-helix domain-containing protein [Aneurinibacillus tyrosinisolvens]